MDRWRDEPVLRLTIVLLTGGLVLLGFGAAGVGSSPLVPLVLLVAATGLSVLANRLAGSDVDRLDRHRFYADLPLGPAVASVVALAWLGATPGELQALGGLVGLVGMCNYFLRPLYRLAYRLSRRVAGVGA